MLERRVDEREDVGLTERDRYNRLFVEMKSISQTILNAVSTRLMFLNSFSVFSTVSQRGSRKTRN